MLYGVYQDWVHKNPGKHLDGGFVEESKWQAWWRKIVCMSTQCYDTPSREVSKSFVGILSIELDGFCASKCNVERVIVFQSIIIKRSQGVNNSAQIHKRILFRLNCWDRGAFDKLVKYTYNSTMGYLRRSRRNQTEGQRHRTFPNLFLKITLRKSV